MKRNRPEFKPHDDFIIGLKKTAKVTREEFMKFIRNSHEHMLELSQIIQQYDQTIDDYLEEWDGRFESFDDDVKDLLNLWIKDGTMDHIINENLMNIKADKTFVDDLNENITSQLAKTYSKHTKSDDRFKPLVTFYLDDGYEQDYTLVFPKAKQMGIPFTTALHNNSWAVTHIDTTLEMIENGWEIHAHTTHDQDLTAATLEEKRQTMRDNKELLEEVTGHEVTGVCYPRGLADEETLKVAREFFEVGMGSGSVYSHAHRRHNDTPIDTYNIDRYMGAAGTLENAKKYIDDLEEAGRGWLVIYAHSNQFPSPSMDALFELMEYVQSKGIDTVTSKDAMKMYGNTLDIGDYSYAENQFKIGADGSIDSNSNPIVYDSLTDISTVIDKKGTDFSGGKVTINRVRGPVLGIPNSIGVGTLYTNRLFSSRQVIGADANQMYETNSTGALWTRTYSTARGWSDWLPISKMYTEGLSDYTTETPMTDYPDGVVTTKSYALERFGPVLNVVGTGLVTTNRLIGSPEYQYQTFIPYGSSNKIYMRRWNDSSKTWRNWTIQMPVTKEISVTYDFGSVPANSSVSFEIDIDGLAWGDFIQYAIRDGLPVGVLSTLEYRVANKGRVNLYNGTSSSKTVGNKTIAIRLS